MKDEKKHSLKITHLKRREVQAPIVSSLIRGFANEIGYENAIGIAKEVIREDAVLSGKTLAEEYSGNSISELSKIAKEVWAKDVALEIKMVKETEKELFFDVTHCRYAEIYEKLGVKNLGCILSCIRDFYFLEGFNPKITLKRTITIMEGGDYCDFRYVVEE
ncbi:MAG: L-2-amino-thiazoline-4-carboxylic acid hydrolase [Desulfobacterales bacterium]|nr:MAG: L-2-amino-thiazoline-4-carboxylic acid hydrolase [Desulfobacterales bacterium]